MLACSGILSLISPYWWSEETIAGTGGAQLLLQKAAAAAGAGAEPLVQGVYGSDGSSMDGGDAGDPGSSGRGGQGPNSGAGGSGGEGLADAEASGGSGGGSGGGDGGSGGRGGGSGSGGGGSGGSSGGPWDGFEQFPPPGGFDPVMLVPVALAAATAGLSALFGGGDSSAQARRRSHTSSNPMRREALRQLKNSSSTAKGSSEQGADSSVSTGATGQQQHAGHRSSRARSAAAARAAVLVTAADVQAAAAAGVPCQALADSLKRQATAANLSTDEVVAHFFQVYNIACFVAADRKSHSRSTAGPACNKTKQPCAQPLHDWLGAMSKTKAKLLSAKEVTDLLRSRGGVEFETAKYPLRAGVEDYEWRDYVRGKDLAKFLRGKQELLDQFTKAQGPERTQEDQVSDLMVKIMQAKLMSPADRKFKKPKPGKKKVVKWPKTLEHAEDPSEWNEELFYVFNYEKPTGAMFYVGAGLVVLAVLGCTLFPLAPYWFKLIVLRLLTGLLFLMLGTLLVRYLVWGAVWLLTGSHFWILPNLMSETVPLPDLFKPVLDYKPRDPDDKLSSLWARGAVAALLGACCWALLVMGPDAKMVKDSVQDAQDSVLRYFDMVDAQRGRLANGTNTTGIEANRTASPGAAGSRSSSGGTAGSAQQEEEDVGAEGEAAAEEAAAAGGGDAEDGEGSRSKS